MKIYEKPQAECVLFSSREEITSDELLSGNQGVTDNPFLRGDEVGGNI